MSRQRIQRRAAQSSGVEGRENLADLRLVAREARLRGIVQIDDLMLSVRQHYAGRGAIQCMANAGVLRGHRAFGIDLVAQFALHLVESQQYLAGLIGAGGLDLIVVMPFRDPTEHGDGGRQRPGERLGDEPGERDGQCERQDADAGGPIAPEGEVGCALVQGCS